MALTGAERIRKYRQTDKGRKAMTAWNKKTRGTPQRRALYQIDHLVRTGVLRRASEHKCTDCGKAASVYDHRDYSKPKEVDPVCRSCNFHRGPAKSR